MEKTKIAGEILRVRLSQMVINEKCKNNEFKIPIHLAMGHEAAAVAVVQAMGEDDLLALSHRNIHYNLARSGKLKPELDEYLLKKEGMAGGRLGSMNLADPANGLVYTSSILGNNFPVAAGIALGQKIKAKENAVFVVGGDGSMEEGSFYESLVFSKSNRLKCIVIVENNTWSLATRIEERRCQIDLEKFADSLRIAYLKLSGNNVYEYIEKIKNLRQDVILSEEPALVEIEISTLGGWHKEGRFINYHAGAAPEVSLSAGALIENSAGDPVFALEKHFSKPELQEMEKDLLEKIKKETNEIY